jgi:exonuclease III
MILSSLNIRGLGGAVKRSSIKDLLRKEKVDFLALQETKMELITDSVCYGLWGGEDCQ